MRPPVFLTLYQKTVVPFTDDHVFEQIEQLNFSFKFWMYFWQFDFELKIAIYRSLVLFLSSLKRFLRCASTSSMYSLVLGSAIGAL